ncbi:hypothetical protein BSLG_001498 [Batrachochytrium salamandrivorans]|nr:hypothetical protein BASA81_009219 [Batrachochytrium salamandrivorans]KAJ1343948.1 hypothetical protein BSLG_001498 [Batrachochytrium salamandrivorans]
MMVQRAMWTTRAVTAATSSTDIIRGCLLRTVRQDFYRVADRHALLSCIRLLTTQSTLADTVSVTDQEWTHIALNRPLEHSQSNIKVHLVGVYSRATLADLDRIKTVIAKVQPSVVCLGMLPCLESSASPTQGHTVWPLSISNPSHNDLHHRHESRLRSRDIVEQVLTLLDPLVTHIQIFRKICTPSDIQSAADKHIFDEAHSRNKLVDRSQHPYMSPSIFARVIYRLLSYAAFGGHRNVSHDSFQHMSIQDVDMRVRIWGVFYRTALYWSVVLPNAVLVEQLRRVVCDAAASCAAQALTPNRSGQPASQSSASAPASGIQRRDIVLIVDKLHVAGIGAMWADVVKNTRFVYGGKHANTLIDSDSRSFLTEWITAHKNGDILPGETSLASSTDSRNVGKEMSSMYTDRRGTGRYRSVVVVSSSKINRSGHAFDDGYGHHATSVASPSQSTNDPSIPLPLSTERSLRPTPPITDTSLPSADSESSFKTTDKDREIESSKERVRMYKKAKTKFTFID